MSRYISSKNQKVVIVSVSVVLFFALVAVVESIISNHSANNSYASEPNSGPFYIEENGRTYQYEIKIFGKLPNAATPMSFYVYTDNANLSFAEVSRALISQQHTDYDFYISEVPIGKSD